MPGWAPPGKEANAGRWRYDMRRGYVQPGMSTDTQGTQYELPDGFDPATAPKGFHLVVSPPGTAAPIGEINYTPDTDEIHDRGQLAPVDKTNYSLVSSGRRGWTPSAGASGTARPWSPPARAMVGVGQDAAHYPGEPPNAAGPFSANATPQMPSGDMAVGTNNPGTGFWFRGFGAGSDADGLDPGDAGYDPSTEDDPYATWPDGTLVSDNPNGPAQAPAQAAPAPQAPAAAAQTDPTINAQGGVGSTPEGPTSSGVPPNYTGRVGSIYYVNGKQAGYYTQGPDPNDPTQTKDTYHVAPEKAPAAPKAPTAAGEHWTNVGPARSDGSQIQQNDTTGEQRVVPGPRKDTTTTKPSGYPKTQFVNGQWWQIDAPGSTPHVVAQGTDKAPTAATEHWTTTETRADGSLVQQNDTTGQQRVIPGPKQPRQFYTAGNSIVQVDPNDPNGQGRVVYTAPPNLQLQTLGDGTIVGIDPVTGKSQTIIGDPSAAAQYQANLAQTQANTRQTEANIGATQASTEGTRASTEGTRASTAATRESTRSTQLGELPQVSYAGGNIIVPYGAEADLSYWNPLTGETTQQTMGHRMSLPDYQRAYGITPADSQPPPAVVPQPTSPPSPGATAGGGPPNLPPDFVSLSDPGVAGTSADPTIAADYLTSPPPPTPPAFAQSDISEGINRRPDIQVPDDTLPEDDTGAGASDIQRDLRRDIPNWRGSAGGAKAKTFRGLGSKFLGRGLDDFTPFVGLGQDEGMGMNPPPGTRWQPPLNPRDVVGTGHKFGDALKSGEPLHKGTDLQAVHGTPTQSPVDGMVVQIDNNPRGLGLSVVIQDEQGKEHKLSHLSKALVKPGDHVRAGQQVGKVGSSGKTTGAHLDYRIQRPDGQYENPEPKMPGLTSMPPVPGTEMMTGAGQSDGEDPSGPYDIYEFGDSQGNIFGRQARTKPPKDRWWLGSGQADGEDPSGPYDIYEFGDAQGNIFGRQSRTKPPKDRWWLGSGQAGPTPGTPDLGNAGGSPSPLSSPQTPPAGGSALPPSAGGAPDPRIAMLIAALVQALKGGGAPGGMPGGMPGGNTSPTQSPSPAPPMPGMSGSLPPGMPGMGAGAGSGWRRPGLGAGQATADPSEPDMDTPQWRSWMQDRGLLPSGDNPDFDYSPSPRDPVRRPDLDLGPGQDFGSGADARSMGVGAGGMRLANGNWSDALADTPQNQAQFGQGSGFSGSVGYNGASAGGGGGGGGGGGTGVAISPADQARLQLDSKQLQQSQQAENDRHAETLQQLAQQAQQEADYKAIQDAVNAENARHDKATEDLTQKQQALDLQLETMRETFQGGQTAVQNAMSTMQSALNAPWLQGLLGLGINPGANAGAGVPGESNPWQNLLNVIFGQGGAPGGNNQALNPFGGSNQTVNANSSGAGPKVPTAQQWAAMNPAQRAALQASVMAEGPGAWQNFQTSFQNQSGSQAPDMTQLQAAIQTPEDQLGTQMSADMFGEGPQSFQQRQQQNWSQSSAPGVQQQLLQGTGYGQDQARPSRVRGWSGKRTRRAGMALH